MATRVVEGKKPYTGGKAISIDENKVISLNLRDENNLIIYDAGDDEIYVDLQLDDEITPTSAFPIGVNVGRVIVDNGWDKPGTIISAETTSGDNIKIFYADEGTLWIDNGTGTFKQIYFKSDVDALLLALRNYIDGELAKKQNGVASDTEPENPSEGDLWYDTTNSTMKVWDGTAWQSVGTGGGGSDIEYVTQAEYNALLPGALTDNKHYFIYSTSGGGGWTPTADTIIYYDFENDSGTTVTNQIAGGVNATTSSALSISSLPSGKKYATLSGSTSLNNPPLYTNSAPTFNMNSFTTTCWFKIDTAPSFNFVIWNGNWWSSDADNSICILAPNGSYTEIQFSLRNSGETSISPNTIPNANDGNRHCISCISTSTYTRIIMDGQVIGSGGNGGSTSNSKTIKFGWYGSGSATNTSMSFGAIILGNTGWSDSDCISYYDQTKGDYGIS